MLHFNIYFKHVGIFIRLHVYTVNCESQFSFYLFTKIVSS